MSIQDQLAGLAGNPPAGVGEAVALGTGLADGYGFYDSPLGRVVVTFNPDGVSSVDLADDHFQDRFDQRFGRSLLQAEAPSSWGRGIEDAIEAGRPGRLPVDLRSVTPFRADVLGAASSIPRGEVRPYSWLAAEVGRPNAVRAAGSAVAANPLPLIIPCHRVVRSDGGVGNYSLGGPENKLELLRREGAEPERLEDLARAHVRYQGNISTGVVCHPTCHALRRSKISNVAGFHTLDEAHRQGFRSCKVCRPR